MLKLAIDFGTAVTKIYKIGSGIVLSEPTCVTLQKDTGEIRAFGSEAKRLIVAGEVKVNGETETRRGRKLRPGDAVEVRGRVFALTAEDEAS